MTMMVKLASVALLSLAATSAAMAAVVPEIDVASSVGAMSLLAAAVALVAERSRKK